jgi:hypothetical protein
MKSCLEFPKALEKDREKRVFAPGIREPFDARTGTFPYANTHRKNLQLSI